MSEVVGMAAGKGTLGLLGQQLWPVPSLPSPGKPQLCSEDTQLIGRGPPRRPSTISPLKAGGCGLYHSYKMPSQQHLG